MDQVSVLTLISEQEGSIYALNMKFLQYFLSYSLFLDALEDSIPIKSRQDDKFEKIHVDWREKDFTNCEMPEKIKMYEYYFINRELRKTAGEEYFVYFIDPMPGTNTKPVRVPEDALATLYATPTGTCRLGNTLLRNCGLEMNLLKVCFERAWNYFKVGGKGIGFDPTNEDPNKWTNQDIAKEAEKHCKLIINFELSDLVARTVAEAVHDIASGIVAAKESKFKGKKKMRTVDLIFSNKKPNTDMTNMVMFNGFDDVLDILFAPDKLFLNENPLSAISESTARTLINRVMPMFFCISDGKWNPEVSDKSTNQIIMDILKVIKPNPKPTPKH